MNCKDCGEIHTGHHDRTEMSRIGGNSIYVQPCDISKGGRSFERTKAGRAAAEQYYRECRDNHERVCMKDGSGYVDPRDMPYQCPEAFFVDGVCENCGARFGQDVAHGSQL